MAASLPSDSSLVMTDTREPRATPFPIVGIGASAGGLEAFEAFFRACPADTDMGFVLVPHLDPDHVSLLTEILQRNYRHARLLLVEDDPINQEVALIVLGDIGWQIDIANYGQEAVERATANAYDLILMDMQMPVMGGVEATRIIRQLPQHRHVPILAMTANAFDEDRRTCLAAGMNDFITKPVVPEKLFGMLLKWLGRPDNRPGSLQRNSP